MTSPIHIAAPPSCRDCAHVELIAVTLDGHSTPRDRCAHPAGPKPMHDGCGWRKEKARIDGAATPPRA